MNILIHLQSKQIDEIILKKLENIKKLTLRQLNYIIKREEVNV